MTFSRVLQERSPTSRSSTSRRWSRASTCCCSSRARSFAAWRSSRSTRASTAPSSRGARRPRSTPSSPRATPGGRGSRSSSGQGPVVQHGHRRRPLPLLPQLVRRPEHPVRVFVGHVARLAGGRGGRAPDRGARARARPARRGVRGAARRGRAQGVRRAARPLAHGLPLRRGAQVLLRLLVPDALVEQAARVRRSAREARLPRGRRGRLPARPPRGGEALDELLLTWATGGAPLGPAHWPPIVARRKELLERLGELDAAARDRRDARGDHRPDRRSCSGASRPSACRSGRSADEGGGRAHRRRRVAGHRSRASRAS